MSVFTALPQDMLQWEINRFLDPLSRLQWNEVLKRDERVYKKFPKDYAIKHQIMISYNKYQDIAMRLQINLDRLEVDENKSRDIAMRLKINFDRLDHEAIARRRVLKAVKFLEMYFAWFKDPKNHLVIMYIKGRKERFLENIVQWTEEDMTLYDILCGDDIQDLRDEAFQLVSLVESIPFIRNIPMAGHKNAFTAK